MRRAVATLAALAWLSLPVSASARHPRGSASSPPLLDVPYVSQTELLCGGAAAAMLMRAAGARGVYAEDFRSLIDAASGGIHTQALADALRARGYRVRVFRGTGALARQRIADGQPVLALVEDRPGRFHYVVLVGWTAGQVVFHDPARAPFRKRPEADFQRSWAASERWMLVIDTAPTRGGERQAADADERPASPERQAATASFVDRKYEEAARLASVAVTINPADRTAWRLLAASRYLLGDSGPALDAWNRAGDPAIDLVRIGGLSRTPHRTIERLMALHPGATLTQSDLVRADRRLAMLPARDASRVTYVALPGNLAEVRGAVVERPLYPSRVEWIATGARIAIDREVSIPLVNLAHSGDRLSATYRFYQGRPAAGVSFTFPSASLGGIAGLSLQWQQEHYAAAAPSELRQASVAWSNWVTSRLRLAGGGGLGEWLDRGRAALVHAEAEFRPVSDRVGLELLSQGAAATAMPFASGTVRFRWRERLGALQLLGSTAFAHASSNAPMDHWPGAGTGAGRPLLLRAHPLLHDGRIDGAAFGRTVAQGSVELQKDMAQRSLATLGLAGFADVAQAWRRPDGSTSPLHVDVGIGLRLRLAPGQPTIRVDLAHGLRDGRTALSAGWQLSWFTKSRS